MFNLTGTEIVVILLLALVVLGPEKLPDAIRRFGRTYSELKKMSTGFQQEFRSALDEPMREMRESADLLRRSTDFSVDRSPDLRPAEPAGPTGSAEPTDELPFAEERGDGGDEHDGSAPAAEQAGDAHDGDPVKTRSQATERLDDPGPEQPGADGSGPA